MTSPTAAPEEVFYNANGIIVTPALIRFSNQTFPVAAINSVAFGKTEARSYEGGIVFVLILSTVLAGVVLISGTTEAGTMAPGVPLAAVAFIVVGVFIAMMVAAHARSQHATYNVVLTTSGGELRPFSSSDPAPAQELLNAIERAMIACRSGLSAPVQPATATPFPPSHSSHFGGN